MSDTSATAFEPERRLSEAAPSSVRGRRRACRRPAPLRRRLTGTRTPATVDDAADSWELGRSSACEASRSVPGWTSKSALRPSADSGVMREERVGPEVVVVLDARDPAEPVLVVVVLPAVDS